ncbi:hypothetical protein [Pantoea sp. SJZ147]|uniref:hypothetical protein n=1 Tax=Pantoea sp. SJZ147 TaxID=2572896 RepID=UPI00119F4935|nr:hypothetical protein [Pantoea sp. SJZ147]TWD32306.1 hypothetical protein FBY13_11929 [Pantoea sp. SJZ147]
MTTNSPNPVDGDVQALIERLNRIAARLKWNNVGYAQDVLKAVDLLTTPPAQLLRPVELPDEAPNALVALCQQMYDYKFTGQTVAHDVWQDCLDELHLNATAQPVSDGCKLPEGWKMVPIEPTEEMMIAGFESEPDESFSEEAEWEKYQAMSGCQQAKHRARLCWDAMLAAAPGGQ